MTGKSTHPFQGEGFDYAKELKFWDDFAETYSGFQQGDMPDRIVEYLHGNKYISKTSSVLELGCGPGTYSFHIANVSKNVVCIDTSPRMLKKLKEDPRFQSHGNLKPVLSDFRTFESPRRFHAVFSSMCPGMGKKESVLKMESLSDRYCISVIWVENNWDNIHAEIWAEMGKDYSFEGRLENVMGDTLEALGRKYSQMVFESEITMSGTLDSLIGKTTEGFKKYDIEENVEPYVEKVLMKHSQNGEFNLKYTNSIRLTVWEVP